MHLTAQTVKGTSWTLTYLVRPLSLHWGSRVWWEHPQLLAVMVTVTKWVTTGGPLALLGEAVSDASIVPGLWVTMP